MLVVNQIKGHFNDMLTFDVLNTVSNHRMIRSTCTENDSRSINTVYRIPVIDSAFAVSYISLMFCLTSIYLTEEHFDACTKYGCNYFKKQTPNLIKWIDFFCCWQFLQVFNPTKCRWFWRGLSNHNCIVEKFVFNLFYEREKVQRLNTSF